MDLKDISSLDFYEEKEPPKETATQDSATFNKEEIEVKPASIKETLDFKNNNNP